MSNAKLDLSQLALDRAPASEGKPRSHRRRWLTRYALPGSMLFGFLTLLAVAAGTSILPRPTVEVVPVIVKRTLQQTAGTPLFQAPGWIEPRPTAISVAALAPGVIDELLVVEGQSVAKDEPIARLIAIDAEIALEQAQAALAIREGELARAVAELRAAEIRRRQPVHLRVPLADAQSMLAKTQTELDKLPFLIEAAEANVQFALSSWQGKRLAQSAIAGRVVEQAQSEHAAAAAQLHELQHREPNLRQEVRALQGKVDALQKQLDLLIEESRQVAEAEAKVQTATALRDEAQSRLRQAELTRQRTVIRAPIPGRILRLVASPGSRVMGLEANAGQSSSTVVEMYDPSRLQVRADVRLEDVPLVTRGQPVEIKTAAIAGVLQGRVLHTTSTASVQKNTLEVKVELFDPPDTVSPEMLVATTFLAPQTAAAMEPASRVERLYVPRQLVHH
ncbi:MAG: efflux RND transporter periplasmic adaptor subunit, partial [Planctomycetales bacterium]|nr:efflux RND transporter periplasmic adaptor subunit [Planctomycetales bacterium]